MSTGEWEEFPTYLELFTAVQEYLKKRFQENVGFNSKPVAQPVYNFTPADILFVIVSAIGWTFLRKVITESFSKPLGRHYVLTPSNQSKMPESVWKFLYYLTAWSVNCYILILSGDHEFFQKPSSVWTGWSLTESLPPKMYLFYMAQGGFYLHSIYATIFMDTWRKDSIIMIIHHASTLILIVFSFALRCHNIGCFVLFLHDICDIFLEFSKLNVYFKSQGDKIVKMHEWLANIAFLSFTVVW
ncbi:ceramide synthase 1 [Parasteatoda tepidariorum]|uniref:ceramide synthase 1 n=1 Tax=Parasteatoda tepidariorum TaxID=114398 RepID=UPI001C726E4D|nr:ceramide synthase 1 [Parasteatoda tepidariorum]